MNVKKKKKKKKIRKYFLRIIKLRDLKDKFRQSLCFHLVTCYIRHNLLQDPTYKKNNCEINKCEIAKQKAQIKVRKISEYCWR